MRETIAPQVPAHRTITIFDRMKLAATILNPFKQNDANRSEILRNQLIQYLFQPHEVYTGKYTQMNVAEQVKANISYVYICTSLIADRCATIKLKLFKNNADGTKTEITMHPFLDLWRTVNPNMNAYEMRSFIYTSLAVTGNCYIYTPKYKNGIMKGLPAEIWPMLPQNVRIIPDKIKYIGGYYYIYNGQQIYFSPDEVIQFRLPNLNDTFYGMSPMQAAAYASDSNIYIKQYRAGVFKNRAVPDSLIGINSPYNEAQAQRFEDSWNLKHQGVDNAGKIDILWGDIKYQQIAMSAKDLDYIAGEKIGRDEIFGIYKVPQALIFTESVNRSNMETAEYSLALNVVLPYTTLIHEKINEKVLLQYDMALECEHASPIPRFSEDIIAERASNLTTAFSNINQERKKAGESPVPWGDWPLIPFTLMPFRGEARTPPAGAEPGKGHKHSHKAQDEEQAARREIMRAAIWKTLKRIDQVHTRKFQADLVVFFKEQRAEVIRNLEGEKAQGIKTKALFNMAKANKALEKIGLKNIQPAAQAGAESAANIFNLSVDWTVVNENIRRWVGERAREYSEWVNETTWQQLQDAISEGVTEGEAIPELTARINEYFDGVIASRAEMIARTETITAANEGNLDVYKDAGVEKKEWYATPGACDVCIAIEAAGPIPINELFLDEFDTPTAHPNCKCAVLPVID